MEKSRLYVLYGIYNCIISYYVLETIIDTERYVDLLCDTATCLYFRKTNNELLYLM